MTTRRSILVGVGQFAYIAGAAVLGGVLFELVQSSNPNGVWISLVVVLVYLGPLGLAGVAGILFPLFLFVVGVGPDGIDPVGLPVTIVFAAAVAAVNVVVLTRWLNTRRERPTDSTRGRFRGKGSADHAAGAVFFSLAACAFIALSFVAGAAALLARGVDTPVPPSRADPILLTAALTWWPGLALAIAGLVLWIIRARRGKPIFVMALVEFFVMVALIVIVFPAASIAGNQG